jgi:hypothetical protein
MSTTPVTDEGDSDHSFFIGQLDHSKHEDFINKHSAWLILEESRGGPGTVPPLFLEHAQKWAKASSQERRNKVASCLESYALIFLVTEELIRADRFPFSQLGLIGWLRIWVRLRLGRRSRNKLPAPAEPARQSKV